MTTLAAACGIMIVLLGLWSTGGHPTDGQLAVEITCLVGGLILCFQAVVLSQLNALSRRFDDAVGPLEDAIDDEAAYEQPGPRSYFGAIRNWKALLRLR